MERKLSKDDIASLNSATEHLELLCDDISGGIEECEQMWAELLNQNSGSILVSEYDISDLCKEVGTKYAELSEQITQLISMDNELLNLLDDIRQCIDNCSLHRFAEEGAMIKPCSGSSSLGSESSVGSIGSPTRPSSASSSFCMESLIASADVGSNLYDHLQINKHLERIRKCSQTVSGIRKLLNYADDDEIEFDDLNRKHDEFKTMVPKYQDLISDIRVTLMSF